MRAQIQQLAQLGIFLLQLLDQLQALGLRDGAGLKFLCGILRCLQAAKVLAQPFKDPCRLQRQPLQWRQNNGDAGPNRLRNLEPVV